MRWLSLLLPLSLSAFAAGPRRPHPDAPAKVKIQQCAAPRPGPPGRAPDELIEPGAFSPFDVRALAWSPDAKTSLLVGRTQLALTDVATGHSRVFEHDGLQQNLDWGGDCVGAVGYSSDGRFVFVSDFVGVLIHDATSGARLGFVNQPVRIVGRFDALNLPPHPLVALSAGAKVLALRDAHEKREVSLVNVATELELRRVRAAAEVSALAFSADGTQLALLSVGRPGHLELIDVASGAVTRTHDVGTISTSARPAELVFTSPSTVQLRVAARVSLIDLQKGELSRKTVGVSGKLAPDGTRALVIVEPLGAFRQLARLVDATTGTRLSPSRWFDGGAAALAVAADGTLAFAALEQDAGLGFVSADRKRRTRLALETDRDTRLAFSPDGQVLYASDRKHRLHRFASGDFTRLAQGTVGADEVVRELVPSPDGTWLAVVVEVRNAKTFLLRVDAQTLKELSRVPDGVLPRFAGAAPVFAYLEGPGRRAATLVIEHSRTGQPLARLPPMDALALTPDGRFVVGRQGQTFVQQRISDGAVVAKGLEDPFLNLARASADGALAVFSSPPRGALLVGSPFTPTRVDALDDTYGRNLVFAPGDATTLYGMGVDGSLGRWTLRPPPAPDTEPLPVATRTREGVQAQVDAQRARFAACLAKPPAKARAELTLWLGASGRTVSAQVERALNGTAEGDCLTQAAMDATFPPAASAQETFVVEVHR